LTAQSKTADVLVQNFLDIKCRQLSTQNCKTNSLKTAMSWAGSLRSGVLPIELHTLVFGYDRIWTSIS